jgi:hypothetical protein
VPINNGGSNLNAGVIWNNLAAVLKSHRDALTAINSEFSWTSEIGAADLEAAPFNMSAADAAALLTAVNDAHAEYLIHTTGLPPSTYPQPGSAYIYAASQSAVIGP